MPAGIAAAGGSIISGLLGNSGQQQAQQQAGQNSIAQTQALFGDATAYADKLRAGLQSQIQGLGPNPFISALSRLQKPSGNANANMTTVGMSGVPQYSGDGASIAPAMSGTPTSGGGAVANPFAAYAQRMTQPVARQPMNFTPRAAM